MVSPDTLAADDPDLVRTAAEVERLMLEAADALRFEEAALLRDELHALRSEAIAEFGDVELVEMQPSPGEP